MSPAMASSGGHGAAGAKNLRVLLPFSCDSLRIPDELAEEIGVGDGGSGEALVVGPSAKLWRVEVGWDLDGAFLGRGWPEFTDACGVEAGWLLVLRHHGRGVLTVKAFDTSCCLRELGSPTPPADEAAESSKDTSRKPQFVRVRAPDFMEKMLIPAEFVQHYIPKEHLNNATAIVFVPLGEVWRMELEINRSNVFVGGCWSHFLAFHRITKDNYLLLRYEGNMVFTVKVFEPDGCLRESKEKDIRMQQSEQNIRSKLQGFEKQHEATPTIQKNKRPSSEVQKKSKGSMTSLKKAPLQRISFYEFGPPSWIRKQINTNAIKHHLVSRSISLLRKNIRINVSSKKNIRINLYVQQEYELELQGKALAKAFCDTIGLSEPCTITLKTSTCGTRSWQVCGRPHKSGSYLLMAGWKQFCRDNTLKEGDFCTFNIIESTLWHAVITRYIRKQHEIPCASSRKRKSKNGSALPAGCVGRLSPGKLARSRSTSLSSTRS
ncbi:hypothetical protein ACP70R_011896 [Stipagrostis hirtigluma subsp. patula]